MVARHTARAHPASDNGGPGTARLGETAPVDGANQHRCSAQQFRTGCTAIYCMRRGSGNTRRPCPIPAVPPHPLSLTQPHAMSVRRARRSSIHLGPRDVHRSSAIPNACEASRYAKSPRRGASQRGSECVLPTIGHVQEAVLILVLVVHRLQRSHRGRQRALVHE